MNKGVLKAKVIKPFSKQFYWMSSHLNIFDDDKE